MLPPNIKSPDCIHVDCPHCGSVRGKLCLDSKGKEKLQWHKERLRIYHEHKGIYLICHNCSEQYLYYSTHSTDSCIRSLSGRVQKLESQIEDVLTELRQIERDRYPNQYNL